MRWILKLTGYTLLALVFALALYTVPPTIEAEILSQAQRALKKEAMHWVLISIDGRDITVSGSPPDAASAHKAIELLNQTPGVRTVKATWKTPESATHKDDQTDNNVDPASIDEKPDTGNDDPLQTINLPVQPAPDGAP